MKIAIRGHVSRGKEVIQILENLGGINRYVQSGSNKNFIYFINNVGLIYSVALQICSNERKIYTLEEFEKEFPFKVGDIVLLKGNNDPYEIVALKWFNNKLCYKLNNGFHYTPEKLTTYKEMKEEMKEERNIKLTLEKAQEWYKKGGELKEIALQAFSEKELTEVELPKTWEEFCDNYNINDDEAYIDSCCMVSSADITCRNSLYDKNVCPSKKSAEAHLAMIQLEQLRDCWRQGWKPNWLDDTLNYVIEGWRDDYTVDNKQVTHGFLSFPTYKMAAEFLECFRDLIEKAGDLI